MTLKAILFNFNGVIIKDDFIHQQLVDDILLAENLSPSGIQYQQFYLGKSDRIGMKNLFSIRGRVADDKYLEKLLNKKAQAYQQIMDQIEQLPIVDKVVEFILQTQSKHIPLAIVTGASTPEIEYVLTRSNLRQYFPVVVSGNDVETCKPDSQCYFQAVKKLNQAYPDLSLQANQCLAIEDTPIGLQAARNAGLQAVGVANNYPFHMLQRQSNWCVDNLMELDLDWINSQMSGEKISVSS